MVRFSCFNAHGYTDKPKKTGQLSREAMHKALHSFSQNRASVHFNDEGDHLVSDVVNHASSSSTIERGWKSEEINSKFVVKSGIGAHQTRRITKSISFGGRLDWEGRASGDGSSEGEKESENSQNEPVVPLGGENLETGLRSQCQEAPPSDSFHVSSDVVNNESMFSIGDGQQYEKEGFDNSDTQLSGDHADESSDQMPRSPPVIVKSKSLSNINVSDESSSPLKHMAPRSRSSEDLHHLASRQKDRVVHGNGTQVGNQERDDCVSNNEKNNSEHRSEGCNSYNYVGSAKDWIVPVMDEGEMVKSLQGESSAHQSEDLTSTDYKIKRIEEWVIDLQHCSPLEETNEILDTNEFQVPKEPVHLGARLDVKVTPGMEAAKKYISSLGASTTAVQLANHGLVVIPFLSAFVSLKTLNLSGNAIVRITAGALPRGLHVLNLSKNSISTIEGLRELTRLRILDLSYNRIVRIGHGLASCSSLKELYLAGNKISEVEGLHRLLKLNVLDLRFNKISTAKCLGQLAANYNSLQAISLEGNPAQKNVGDEQLKKYLQGLLPHLSYYNRQSIKAGALKDDKSARLGIAGPQIDRGLRSDHKNLRKGSHAVAAHKALSSSTHSRRGQAIVSPKRSKAKHGHLPPMGTKAVGNHRHQLYDFSSKLLSLRSELSIRRSRSEGTLAAL